MSNLQTIISEIANQLESNGAVYSQRPLQTLASAMSFLQAFGISVDDDIYSAAIAATMLQPEDACSVVKRIGIEFPLVPSIEPAIFGYEPQLARFIQNGDHRQAVVAATILFVWYSAAAQRGDSNRLRKMHGVVELHANNGLNQDIGKSLLAEIDKVVDRQPPASLPDSNALFSISIDLVGSTAAKSNVMRAAIGDHARIDALNVQIYNEADSSSKCNSSWFFCVPHFHAEEYLMRGFITQHLSGAMIKPLYRPLHLRIRDLQQFHLFGEILP